MIIWRAHGALGSMQRTEELSYSGLPGQKGLDRIKRSNERAWTCCLVRLTKLRNSRQGRPDKT